MTTTAIQSQQQQSLEHQNQLVPAGPTDPYVIYQLRKPNQRGTAVIPRFVPNTHAPAVSPANYRFARVWATDTATSLLNAPRSFEYAASLGSDSSFWSDTSSYLSLSTLRTTASERPPLLHHSHQPHSLFLPIPNQSSCPTNNNNINNNPTTIVNSAHHSQFSYPRALEQSVDEDALVDDLLSALPSPQFPTLRVPTNIQNPSSNTLISHNLPLALSPHPTTTTQSSPTPPHSQTRHPRKQHIRSSLAAWLPARTKKRRSLWQWLFCSRSSANSVALASVASVASSRPTIDSITCSRSIQRTPQTPPQNISSVPPRSRFANHPMHDTISARKPPRPPRIRTHHSVPNTSPKPHHTDTPPAAPSWRFLSKHLSKHNPRRRPTAPKPPKSPKSPKSPKQTTHHHHHRPSSTTTPSHEAHPSTPHNRIVFHRPGHRDSPEKSSVVKQRSNSRERSHQSSRQHSPLHRSTTPDRPRQATPVKASQTDELPQSPKIARSNSDQSDRSNSDTSRASVSKRRSSLDTHQRKRSTSDNQPREDRPRLPRRRGSRNSTASSNHNSHCDINQAKTNTCVMDNFITGVAATSHAEMRRLASAESAEPVTSRISSDLSSSTYGRVSTSNSAHSVTRHEAGNTRRSSVPDIDPGGTGIGSDVSSLVSAGVGKASSPSVQLNYIPIRVNSPDVGNTLPTSMTQNAEKRQSSSSRGSSHISFPVVSINSHSAEGFSREKQQFTDLPPIPTFSGKLPKNAVEEPFDPTAEEAALDPISIARKKNKARSVGGPLSYLGTQHDTLPEFDTLSTGLTSLADESVSTHKSICSRLSGHNVGFPYVTDMSTGVPHYADDNSSSAENLSSTNESLGARKPIFQNSALVMSRNLSPSRSNTTSPKQCDIDVFCQCACNCVYEEECRRRCEFVFGRSPSASSSRSRQYYPGFMGLPPSMNSRRAEVRTQASGNTNKGMNTTQADDAGVATHEKHVKRKFVRANEVDDELPDPRPRAYKPYAFAMNRSDREDMDSGSGSAGTLERRHHSVRQANKRHYEAHDGQQVDAKSRDNGNGRHSLPKSTSTRRQHRSRSNSHNVKVEEGKRGESERKADRDVRNGSRPGRENCMGNSYVVKRSGLPPHGKKKVSMANETKVYEVYEVENKNRRGGADGQSDHVGASKGSMELNRKSVDRARPDTPTVNAERAFAAKIKMEQGDLLGSTSNCNLSSRPPLIGLSGK